MKNDEDYQQLSQQEFSSNTPVTDNLSNDGGLDTSASRRDFLRYLGFSVGAATLAASCEIPVRRAIPYVVKPDQIVPGVATYYASSFVQGGDYCPILVKTREGRPIKIEGNSLSKITNGGTSARAQASVLGLYNISRLDGPYRIVDGQPDRANDRNARGPEWAEMDKEIMGKLNSSANIRIVSHTLMSPTTERAMADFKKKYPNAELVMYDPVSSSAILEANQSSFGQAVIPSYHFDKAMVIAGFDADFLGTWISPEEYSIGYVKHRRIKDVKNVKLSRHVQIESAMSLTGSNADHRIMVRPSEQGAAIAALYNELAGKAGRQSVRAPKLDGDKAAKIKKLAGQLYDNRTAALVVSGSNNVGEQLLVNAINDILGSYGNTIDFTHASLQRRGMDKNMRRLVLDMKKGAVDAVFFMDGANPAYDVPNADQFQEALAKVKLKVSFSGVPNETMALCDYATPTHHFLESWGDVMPKRGHYSIIQPAIAPIFKNVGRVGTRQVEETLLTWAGYAPVEAAPVEDNAPDSTEVTSIEQIASESIAAAPDSTASDSTVAAAVPTAVPTGDSPENNPNYYEKAKSNIDDFVFGYMQRVWREELFPQQSNFATFKAFWDSTLHDGVFEAPQATIAMAFSGDVASAAKQIGQPSNAELEVSFYETVNMGGGTYADNPWLQEMPDPVNRCAWGNYLAVPITWEGGNSYTTFMGLNQEEIKGKADIVNLTVGGRERPCTVVTQFGQLAGTLALALGYGRTHTGLMGKALANELGTNVYPWLTYDDNGNVQYYAAVDNISERIAVDEEFACVQYHHTMGLTGTDPDTGEEINVDEKTVMTLGEGMQGGLVDRSIIYQGSQSELGELVHHIEEKRAEAKKLNDNTLYPYDEYNELYYNQGHHWAMHIDLNACTGCGACQVACIAENNVPIVGKREVARHHEMAWLRIDRYFYGDYENPNAVYQPMMCQHCDNAPCENVCPVAATNHSSEGLNQMTYNRCIGTRYCANNCPYKVRRFNWLDYTTADLFGANEPDVNDESIPFGADNLTRMVLNPDVTVRSRGVIEKCSFCVQRIQEGKLTAKREKRTLRDNDVKPACQTACATGAIVFGDRNNKQGELAERLDNPLNYLVLEETNTQSGVFYQARVNNRDERMES